jgi:molybdopterin biosynthesis enzyme
VASTGVAAEHLTFAEARRRVIEGVRLLDGERVALAEARGRILREPLVAPHALPPFRNSSMDGYALRAPTRRPRPRPGPSSCPWSR